jgi:ferredoxin, 2Fe-2S
MPTLIIKNRAGIESTIVAKPGRSLMEILRDSGFDEVQALCGGSCTCATCHVHIESDAFAKVPPMSSYEDDMLEGTGVRDAGSRLSCQVTVTEELEGALITIADEV